MAQPQKMTSKSLSRAWLSWYLSFLLLGVLLVSAGCSTESDHPGDPGSTDDQESLPGEIDCSVSVESLIQNLDVQPDSIPGWEQLDCYTADLIRKPTPSTVIMVGDIPPGTDGSTQFSGVWNLLQTNTEFLQAWPNNEVSGLSDFPPFLSIDGTSSFYPENEERWQMKLRAKALNAIWVKQQNYRARITQFYPPSFYDQENWWKLGAENISSSETFLSWWRTQYIPERQDLAVMAERVKAEILMPWDIEPGVFLRTFGDDWLSSLSPAEQVTLVQTMIDELADALRPLFSGTLSIIIYDRYAAFGQHWDQIDLSSWDQANFVFFTEGNLATTQQYLDEQLAGYMAIIQRSNIPWIAQEVTVSGDTHRRLLLAEDGTFESMEEDIYRMIFTTLAAQPIKPVGVGITTGYIETSGADAYVRSALSGISVNGF